MNAKTVTAARGAGSIQHSKAAAQLARRAVTAEQAELFSELLTVPVAHGKQPIGAYVKALHEAGLEATLLLQIHDELILEAPEAELEEAEGLTRSLMEGVTDLQIPLRVDLSTGTDLADAKG